VMREDFVARIEPFMRILKPLQQTRFRLDLLGPSGAQAAVTGPLRGTARHFKPGVVDTLIEELLKVRVESTDGKATEVIGEYVEPVQLQVVCRNLWTSLPDDVQEISHEHLKAYGDVDQALREFYESCLTDARTGLHTSEANLRQWFERQLITPAGTRGIVFRDAQLTAGLTNQVVDFLENRHIIRGEWRAGSRWYELTHDRLIEPVQHANERWRVQRQARRNRILGLAGGTVVLLLMIFAAFSLQTAALYAVPTNATAVAELEIRQTLVSQSNTLVVEVQSTNVAVQEDASFSKSRQLAAEALLANDRNLSLLLAIQANSSDDTVEGRRSLHKVLSRQSYADGKFLRELRSGLITPTLIRRLDDHQGSVVSVAFSPDGQRFISGSGNGTVLLWEIASLKPIGPSLTTRGSAIESVAYSPDGLRVASAGQDEQISIWNAVTGEPMSDPLSGHEGLVTCLAFSPDGKLLASGGMDFHILIWDVSSGRLMSELKADDTVASLAWSTDGTVLAVGTFDQTVSFWTNDGGSWTEIDRLYGLGNPVRSIAWSPDDTVLAFGLGSADNAPESGDVILWDWEKRQPIQYPLSNAPEQFKPVSFEPAGNGPSTVLYEGPISDTTKRVRSVAFHPAGKILAIGRDDGTITFWDVERGQTLGSPLRAHDHWIMSLAFSPNGYYLLSGSLDRTVALWNLSAPTGSLAVGPDGKRLATSQGPIISLWDLSTEQTEPVKLLTGHTDDVLALAFSPDGRTLVSSGKDNFILFWDVATGQQTGVAIRTLSNVQTLQFSPDGATLAAGGDSGRAQLSDPLTGRVVYQLVAQDRPVLKIQFSTDGKTLDVFGSNGSLTTFDLQSGEPTIVQESVLPSAQDGITSIFLSPDGKRAAYFRAGGTGETAVLGNDGRAHGIKLSYWGQSFDPTMNLDDIDYILVGIQYTDPNFDKYVKQIQSVPLRGAYYSFRENQPWQEQADLFLSTVKDKGFHFYVLSLESPAKGDSTQFLADVEQWLEYVDSQVNGRVLLGTSSTFLSEFGASADWMKEWPLLVGQYPSEANRFFLEEYNGTPQEMGEWLGLNAFSILDRDTGAVIHPNQAVESNSTNSFAFSPDSTYLAAAGDGSVFLLDPATGEEISTLDIGGRTVYSLSFLPDSDHLVIGTDDGTVLLWDLGLLRSAAEIGSMIDIACSQVQANLSPAEWTQYVGVDVPYQATCPELPVP
jgi:WD40 repeat protein